MLINVTVTWHDPHKIEPHKTEIVQVRKRPTEEDYFLGGILNQAMRQHGYSEEEIRAQHYVGPVEFHFKDKEIKPC